MVEGEGSHRTIPFPALNNQLSTIHQPWQHPCGALTPGTESNPREKYPTYFPADAKPA